jgi:hypothetical protein
MRVKTAIKSGGLSGNHSRAGLKIRTGVKASGISSNHSRTLLFL